MSKKILLLKSVGMVKVVLVLGKNVEMYRMYQYEGCYVEFIFSFFSTHGESCVLGSSIVVKIECFDCNYII